MIPYIFSWLKQILVFRKFYFRCMVGIKKFNLLFSNMLKIIPRPQLREGLTLNMQQKICADVPVINIHLSSSFEYMNECKK